MILCVKEKTKGNGSYGFGPTYCANIKNQGTK
jgi:hypothetical protein